MYWLALALSPTHVLEWAKPESQPGGGRWLARRIARAITITAYSYESIGSRKGSQVGRECLSY